MKLITVFFALVMACSGAFAQHKMAWEAQNVLFIVDTESKPTINDDLQFRIENENSFLAAEIIKDEKGMGANPVELVYKAINSQEGYTLISKGDVFRTEQGAKGHYMITEFKEQKIAFAVVLMENQKFPLLVSFSINEEGDVKKVLSNIRKL